MKKHFWSVVFLTSSIFSVSAYAEVSENHHLPSMPNAEPDKGQIVEFDPELELKQEPGEEVDELEELEAEYPMAFQAVPIVLLSESMKTAYGAAGIIKHAGQVQASILGVGLYSSNDSWIGFTGLYNYQLPKMDQWFFSFEAYQGHITEAVIFLDPDDSQGDLSGAQSPERIISLVDESSYKFHAEYVLPIGAGRNGALFSMFERDKEVSWNPLKSGVSSITFTPFYETRELAYFPEVPDTAKGMQVKFEWDNRNNTYSPTQGGRSQFIVKHGVDVDDEAHWTTWEFEQSFFFDLSDNDWFKEQVIATNFYLADTPTWNHYDNSTGKYRRPQDFSGISLGGFDRQRGYNTQEYTGRTALNYSLEYRVKPHWQPLPNWPLFKLYDIPWWQWVAFAEVGNITDEFSFSQLHSDMLYTVGAGVRLEVEDLVIRADYAFNQDGDSHFWVMVNQPF
ncbi:BamA/TamA family outer membrane protein [Shewanella maritima]|uniref:BamA/TamA family outer membrane protein n=1 Tax=Shewanella maritima TaxID=2520507 RepID=UPI00373659C0